MLRKYATTEILGSEMAPSDAAGLRRMAHRHTFDYEPRPGYLYVRSRAISSRTNDNFDTFPADEIKAAYKTFVGKPVFVNHNNDNHRRARGVIIDAALHEDKNPDGSPDTWAEVLMEVDAVRFPKLAKAILDGHIDRTSMGTDVKFSVCSFCNNKASTPLEYCAHIPKLKGKRIYRTTASGQKEGVLVSEICHGLGFFENSLLVEEPADPTAFFLGVDDHSGQKVASRQVPDSVVRAAKNLFTTAGATPQQKQPLIEGHWTMHDSVPGPDGKFRASCSCGAEFPPRDNHMDAYHDKLAHGGSQNPDYNLERIQQRMLDAQNPKPEVPITPEQRQQQADRDKHYRSWSGTNSDNWALASKTAGPFDSACSCKGAQQIEPHSTKEHSVWAEKAHAEGKTDAWGQPLHQPYDGHGAWNCNNYSCAEHPQSMYDHKPGQAPGWMQAEHDPHKELTREVGKHFHEQGLTEDARYLLDQQHDGPSKYSKRLPTTKPVSRPIRPKTATEVYGPSQKIAHEDESFQVHIPEHARQEMADASSAGKMYSEMQDHHQRTPANLNDLHEMRAHLMTAHQESGWVHDASHEELHDFHDNDHHEWHEDWPNAVNMGGHHFHEAALRAEAKGPAFENPADHPSYAYLGIHPQHVIDHWHQASDAEKTQGMRWYEDAHHVAKTIAGGDAHKGAGVLSAYSPQTNWPANMFNAARTFATGKAVKKGEGINVMAMHHNAAHAIMNGVHHHEALNGPKTQDFAHLIEHAGKDPETGKHSKRVVIDRHAMSVLAGRRLSGPEAEHHIGKVLSHRHYYEHSAEAYRHAADHISKHVGHPVAPHQVQAVTWLVRQRLNNAHINDAGGRPASMLKGRQKAERNARDQFNDHMREHHPDHVQDGAPYNMHYNAALVYGGLSPVLAYGETMAPADVDTLRDEECPVCGEADAYDGNECQVCGFVAPPKMFQDPDLDLAKQMDLRQDTFDADQADPNGDGMPDVIPGSGAPGPDNMPMDPSQVPDPQDVAQQQVNQITDNQAPLMPDQVDANGQPIQGDEMSMQEPQEQDPNAQPMDPEDAAGQPEPGTPGDDEADLACGTCGYQAPASPPQSTDMNETTPDAGFAAGALCPNCEQDTLQSLKQMSAEMTEQTGQPMPVQKY